jgi:hypothetical protein
MAAKREDDENLRTEIPNGPWEGAGRDAGPAARTIVIPTKDFSLSV